MPEAHDVDKLISHLFRIEAGKMAAVLTRLLGFEHYEKAEDIVQDTLLKALSVWKIKGIPDNPSAWLHTVAKRKAIDVLREHKLHQGIHTEIAEAMKSEWTFVPAVNQFFLENEIEDSQLRMMFACCHPSIPYDSQLALILKTLCGLSIREIANNFLTNEDTITKRLYRAREKIKDEKIELEAPVAMDIIPRMDAVLHAIYLLFNEGYNSSHADRIIRDELCEEAMRLGVLLTRNTLTDRGEANALLALMCFQASRSEARIDEDGDVVLLQQQDRSRWNQKLIDRGKFYLEKASSGDHFSEYHLEAAIAGIHSSAPAFEETDWNSIYEVYDALSTLRNNVVVDLNKAIALGYARSPKDGLEALHKIQGLEHNHIYHAATGDFYKRLGQPDRAIEAYRKALELSSSPADKKLMNRKISEAGAS